VDRERSARADELQRHGRPSHARHQREAKRTEQLATARRVLTAHVERARDRQRPPLTKTAYGYCREIVPGEFRRQAGQLLPVFRLTPDAGQAEIVRSIYRWFAEGHSLGWIVTELHRRGAASPGGKAWWHRTSIRQVLKNLIYVGRRAWGKTSSGRFHRQ